MEKYMSFVDRHTMNALHAAKEAHQIVVNAIDRSASGYDLGKASINALSGLSHISAAETMYISHLDEIGENELLEDVFALFGLFLNEVINCYSEFHSPSHVLSYFDELMGLVKGTRLDSSIG